MFGADATVQTLYDSTDLTFGKVSNRASTDDGNNLAYLFPKFSIQHPWLIAPVHGERDDFVEEDFILIAEFSEQEGPRPLVSFSKIGPDSVAFIDTIILKICIFLFIKPIIWNFIRPKLE